MAMDLKSSWLALDARIRKWWDRDLHRAGEQEIREDPDGTLLFLPHPYITAGGSEAAFPELYGWDTYFINLALLQHGRLDLVRNHLMNQLFMIERHGMVLNANRTYYLTRSQPPLWADGVWRYFEQSGDLDILYLAYPLLKKEYLDYWLAGHHQTPTGLATNRDLGDPGLRPELAAEAEMGTDFSACFDGDVRACNPVMTNTILVLYARALARMAAALKLEKQARDWHREADARAAGIQAFCWDEARGFYFDYHYLHKKRTSYWSLCGFWPLWAEFATHDQAGRMAENSSRFEHAHGLAQTAECYPSPYPEFDWLQWGYPAGWPPMQYMVVRGLQAYGFTQEATRLAEKFLTLQLHIYDDTGRLWEKYNVVQGNLELPVERYALPAMHGFSSATAVLLGELLFREN